MDSIVKINQAAPEITLLDLKGMERGLDQANADLLILNFWSAECPWSARADAILAELQKEWDGGVEIWSIASNANEGREQIAAAAGERSLRNVFIDLGQTAANRYGAVTTPHFCLLDKDRIVRYIGALDDTSFRQRELSEHYLVNAVQALQAGQIPDPQETHGYGCTIVRYDL